MDSRPSVFLKKLIIYTLIIALLGFIGGYLSVNEFIQKWSWTLVLMFSITSWIMYKVLYSVSRVEGKKFIPWFMGLSGLKMFFFLIVLLGFVLMNRELAVPFVITFFGAYLLFSIFEVIHLLNIPLDGKKASNENS